MYNNKKNSWNPAAVAALLLVACIPQYEDVPTKLVGVGYNPEEIGPSPTPYGGVVEYSLVNFTGSGLSLAMMGFQSFDEIGPDMGGAQPPYRAVYGFSYMFDTKLSAADSLGGVTSVPPDTEESCYTTYEASGPIGSFTTVDVGSYMEFKSSDGKSGFRLDRLPSGYPVNMQDLFIYYSAFDTYQSASFPADDGSADYSPLRPANFPMGQSMAFRFPGGMAPPEAPVSSLPQPSDAIGNTVLTLPNDLGPVMLEWSGPRYDQTGEVLADGGAQATCFSYAAPQNAPESLENCQGSPGLGDPVGQLYTGPWEAEDGAVTFRWTPNEESPNEIVSIAVRFLGPVDASDAEFQEYVVKVPPPDDVVAEYGDVEDGRRAPAPCEEGEWVFDDGLQTADGTYIPSLQGNPLHNVAEVTCRMKDDGEFQLTEAMLEEALIYARRAGAQGAVFYLARSTEAEVVVPPVMNSYEQRLEVSPVKLTSRVIDIGRFWYGE